MVNYCLYSCTFLRLAVTISCIPTQVFWLKLQEDVYFNWSNLILYHVACINLIYSGGSSWGAQCHLLSGVETSPSHAFPSGEPIPDAGLGHSHHSGAAHDPAAPLSHDRSALPPPSSLVHRHFSDNNVTSNTKESFTYHNIILQIKNVMWKITLRQYQQSNSDVLHS